MSDPGLARSPGTGWTHRRAALVLLAALLVCFAPRGWRGEVLYPHDNAAEAGLANEAMDPVVRAFTDQCQLYVPEIAVHLKGAHAQWLPTWNPHNELGRPLFPYGLGRAWILGVVLSWFTSDALIYYTWWAIAAVVGSALFAFLFLRALDLHPLACLAGGLGLSIGPIFGAWQSVPFVQWGFCWALAALLGLESWLRAPSWRSGAWIVFCVHSVLLTGFPQHVLMLGWIVASWLVLRTFQTRAEGRARLRTLAACTGLAALGLLSVAPVWADLLFDWSASTRADYTASSQAWAVEPQRRAALWVGLVSVLWSNDPGCQSLSLSPLFAGLLAVGLLAGRATHAPMWAAWLVASLAGTLYTGANSVLRLLGLSFSEWPPIYAGLLPCAILAGLGADRILRSQPGRRSANTLACLLPFLIAVLHLGGVERAFEPRAVAAALIVAAATLLLVWRPDARLLLVLLGAVAIVDGQALVRWQPRAAIHTDSPLAAEIRRRTADGSRFAWVGPRPAGFRFLPPNHENLLGLSSIHGYDHLMSRAFSRWSRALGSPFYAGRDYERRFDELGAHALLQARELSIAGVSTVVSIEPLDSSLVVDTLRIGDVHVASLPRRATLEARIEADAYTLESHGDARATLPEPGAPGAPTRVATGLDDRLRFDLPPSPRESLLFVSQSFDGRWRADSDGRRLEAVRINDLYQGVVVPPGVGSVELSFRPWSLLMRPIQWVFLLLGLTAAAAAVRTRLLRR